MIIFPFRDDILSFPRGTSFHSVRIFFPFQWNIFLFRGVHLSVSTGSSSHFGRIIIPFQEYIYSFHSEKITFPIQEDHFSFPRGSYLYTESIIFLVRGSSFLSERIILFSCFFSSHLSKFSFFSKRTIFLIGEDHLSFSRGSSFLSERIIFFPASFHLIYANFPFLLIIGIPSHHGGNSFFLQERVHSSSDL
jgi:hypothetical protein